MIIVNKLRLAINICPQNSNPAAKNKPQEMFKGQNIYMSLTKIVAILKSNKPMHYFYEQFEISNIYMSTRQQKQTNPKRSLEVNMNVFIEGQMSILHTNYPMYIYSEQIEICNMHNFYVNKTAI